MQTITEYKQALHGYEKLLNNLDDLIERSPFKLNFMINKLGLTRSTFYHKRRNNGFTIKEMKIILGLIEQVD